MATLEAIKYDDGELCILNQLLLPQESVFEKITGVQDDLFLLCSEVRGAPAIAVLGCLSLAVELRKAEFDSTESLCMYVDDKLDYLTTARPTAVNIGKAAVSLKNFVQTQAAKNPSIAELKASIIKEIENMIKSDVDDNMKIGEYGAEHILQMTNDAKVKVMTHCNTGSLATVKYGTALGVIRSLQSKGRLDHAYCTETRPYNQGARLTAYELVYEKIPSTLIVDSAVSLVLKKHKFSAIVVGADRVVANGDTANKIGTYQLAISAKYHGVPFYVAAPTTSVDLNLETGEQIVIEERSKEEITHFRGEKCAADGIECFNPAFDVTPADLITGGIITELGVFKPSELKEIISKHLVKN
eukprot:gene16996-18708_t